MVTSPESVGWVAHEYVYPFLFRPVSVSATLSTVFLTFPLAWSALPSFFSRLFPVRLPAASFRRPLPLSTFLSVIELAPSIVGVARLDREDRRAYRAF